MSNGIRNAFLAIEKKQHFTVNKMIISIQFFKLFTPGAD